MSKGLNQSDYFSKKIKVIVYFDYFAFQVC